MRCTGMSVCLSTSLSVVCPSTSHLSCNRPRESHGHEWLSTSSHRSSVHALPSNSGRKTELCKAMQPRHVVLESVTSVSHLLSHRQAMSLLMATVNLRRAKCRLEVRCPVASLALFSSRTCGLTSLFFNLLPARHVGGMPSRCVPCRATGVRWSAGIDWRIG